MPNVVGPVYTPAKMTTQVAIRAEDVSDAAVARLAISFQSFAVNDCEELDVFLENRAELLVGAAGVAFAAKGVSAKAEETDTAAEMRSIFALNMLIRPRQAVIAEAKTLLSISTACK